MTFGTKIKELRKKKALSQKELGDSVGVTIRTIRGWEVEGRYPKKHELYTLLAKALDCEVSYLMNEEETFITTAAEEFGTKGENQAKQIINQTAAMFAGGGLSEDDQIAFLQEIQGLYLDSKQRAKKYTPKKYL